MATRNYQKGDDARTAVVTFRVSKAEMAEIKVNALAARLRVSDYARAKVLGGRISPEVVAAHATLTNHLEGLENAVAQAKALLSGKESK